MDSTLSKCPAHQAVTTARAISFKEVPNENIFKKIFFLTIELLSRIRFKSIRNAWRIGSQQDLSKTLALAWKPGSLVSKCPSPIGTIYVTADADVMRAVLQNVRADDEGLFFDHENKRLFIKGILNDIYPEDIKKLGIDKISDMIVMTTSISHIKSLRAPIVSALNSTSIKEFIPQISAIADDILNSLSEEEQSNCNAEELAFEFAVTVISQFLTGYNTTRENYQSLARILNTFSKRMTRIVSHRPATATEEKEYQEALILIKEVIDQNINSNTPTPFVLKLKELGWDTFKIRVNLFFMYFAASETTASSINYLLWQLGNEENKPFLEELRHPERGEHFLSKVVAETLRLHPPAFIIGRQLRCDTILEVKDTQGKIVKHMRLLKGHTILCLTQVAGRDSLQYKEPQRFNPNRFENIPSQLPWYPFGTGNHVCPGQPLAYAELRCLASQMVKKFNIQTLYPKEQFQQYGFFTLRAPAARLKLTDL